MLKRLSAELRAEFQCKQRDSDPLRDRLSGGGRGGGRGRKRG